MEVDVSERTPKAVEPTGRSGAAANGRSGAAANERRGGGATRERILTAATELFTENGTRGTSADRIIERAGITKVTFYRHFRTKTDLVVAYLEGQAQLEREAMEKARSASDAVSALRSIAALIGTFSCMPGFRGCPFINAAAETPDPADPVRRVVDHHRRWIRELFEGVAADAGVEDPGAAGAALTMLRDGALVGGYLGDPDEIGSTLERAFVAVVTADTSDTA